MNRFIIVLFCALVHNICTAQPYRYLVLKGGGIRGIAYTGALKVLEEKGISDSIEKVAGTSVGALSGVLFCTGYTAKQMENMMVDLDVSVFNDGEWYFIGGQERLRKNFGWYKGNELEEWVGNCIKRQTGDENTTFLQLHNMALKNKKFKDLYVTATNLTMQRLEIFSWETRPNMRLKTAVRASVSIPLYYGAAFIDSTGSSTEQQSGDGKYNVYIDGGLMANYPITIFNTEQDNVNQLINKYTLGLKLERPEQMAYQEQHKGIAPYDIHSFSGYLSALYNLTMEQLNKRIPYDEEKKHTIYISTSNLSPKVRHLTAEQKKLLYDNGSAAARKFFEQR